MDTERIPVDPRHPEAAVIARAVTVLLRGGLVAFPTETVYGLGALADDATAAARIFAAKGRPSYNPLIAHVTDAAMARGLAARWSDVAERLAGAFWPGPLTLVVPRDPARIPDVVSAGAPTVALRAPAHPVARALLAALGRPVAAPSANRFQSLTATTADHVLKGLDGRIDMVLDGGPCPYGIESTVVDATCDPPEVLRPGALSLAALATVIPGVRLRHGVLPDGVAAPSPGMLRKHYAPRGRLVVVPAAEVSAVALRSPGPVGVVLHGLAVDIPGATVRALPDDALSYGAGLFAALHALDDAGCATILVASVPVSPAWEAVRDRLARASA